ncbi:MAG: acylphosphatase [Rhodoglobus sp.]|nr:acylphosphatase [Rhodoglobus sp.]
MPAQVRRVRAKVSGRVQGVGFRWSARSEARRLGVAGFVRNLPNGSVEVEAEGDEPAVDAMLDWLAHGPPGALVDDVTTEPLDPEGSETFEIR